jgi:hypothetical protein
MQSRRYINGIKIFFSNLDYRIVTKLLTVSWAVEAMAHLGGYLEHRHQTPIGIQVLWRGWLKLHEKSEGWQLARET